MHSKSDSKELMTFDIAKVIDDEFFWVTFFKISDGS